MVKRVIVMAISVILALAVAAPIASGQPPSQRQDVNTLTDEWWTWALSAPSPLAGDYEGGQQCEGEFVEGVFFLAGTSPLVTTERDAKRTCTVPARTALFFPVINAFITEEEHTAPLVYPEYPTNFVDTALVDGEPYATLDGKDLGFSRITAEPFTLILPEPNIVGQVPGGPYRHSGCADPTRCLATSDGLWVYLPKGLKPGEHEVEFGGNFPNALGGDFSMNITYELIVV
jgi:hypothetical protein